MYKDRKEQTLKVGDKVVNAKGKVMQIQNIEGVSLLVRSDGDKTLETVVLSKVDFKEWELVK